MKLFTNGMSLMLAYDQGLEHGPTDFNDRNVDPEYVMNVAVKGKFNGIILQKGVAEKYYRGKVPLIVKLNGKTRLVRGEPIAPQICSVKEAKELGAEAVGYTIYVGSGHEAEIFEEFGRVQEEAHDRKLKVIAWMYPRGRAIKNDTSEKVLAYAARIGLELGADILKMKYSGDVRTFRWIVRSAGKAKVLVAGGLKTREGEFLKQARDVMKAGAAGMAVGRNVWQHEKPLEITEKIRKIIFGK